MLEELKGILHDQSIEFKRVIGRGARKVGGARWAQARNPRGIQIPPRPGCSH